MRNPPSVSRVPPGGANHPSQPPIDTSDTIMLLPFAAPVNENESSDFPHRFANPRFVSESATYGTGFVTVHTANGAFLGGIALLQLRARMAIRPGLLHPNRA